MVIEKVLSINNLGKIIAWKANGCVWNGQLNKTTAIYADNGSGKTTFTQIFKSLKPEDFELFVKRRTFDSIQPISIKLLSGANQLVEFTNDRWTQSIKNIEVFDAYFVEANIYIINLGNYDTPGKLFGIIVGNEAIATYNEIVAKRKERKKSANTRRSTKNMIKKCSDINVLERYKAKLASLSNQIKKYDEELKVLNARLTTETENYGKGYLDKINEYLEMISPELRLTKLNKHGHKFIYYLSINSHEVRTDKESKSLSRTLSEGEKNSLAFAFFMASLELKGDIEKKLIVFDDPVTSMDYKRRSVTLSILSRFARMADQFILLSHDIYFIKDFTSRNSKVLNLKIIDGGYSSLFVPQDIEFETLTGINKDLHVLNDYLEKGEKSSYSSRDVIRCIRPVLEGFFRIKFYHHIKRTEWLGDIIEHIRTAGEESVFYREKENLNALCDINDYSKAYHHSNPNYLEVPIIASELKLYCKRTIDLLEKL